LYDVAPWTDQKDLKGKTRKESIFIAVGNYAFNTISPIASTAAEPILRHDFNGNTVPWSNEEPLHGGHKLTWKEYLWQQAPIPAAEAARDMYTSMEDSGMDKATINDIFTGVFHGIIAGGTGARVMEYKNDMTDEERKIIKSIKEENKPEAQKEKEKQAKAVAKERSDLHKPTELDKLRVARKYHIKYVP
jgi:hypothetical protein